MSVIDYESARQQVKAQQIKEAFDKGGDEPFTAAEALRTDEYGWAMAATRAGHTEAPSPEVVNLVILALESRERVAKESDEALFAMFPRAGA
ncbi:MAG TPA: hypothetical protein VGW74_07075 [Propionibacteriaceae bacterium]|nr:hypothetical protein [Propionibacteriaceae bacterium]